MDEKMRPPEMITSTILRKAPFVPQMGDEVIYFRQGYKLYLQAVISKDVYPVDLDKNQPWHINPHLRAHELVKIVGIKWMIKKPTRLCCLKLSFLDTETGNLTGRSFTIKYHDMPDVIDFIVLKQHYDISVERGWKPGSRFRSMIDDQWWMGVIVSQEPLGEDDPDSLYQCFNVRWDNGELEKLSPWDMEPIDNKRKPNVVGGGVDVTPDEYKALLYVPKKNEWLACGKEEESKRLTQGLGALMQHSVAEHFSAPVDLQQFPTYTDLVPYPIDLSTIKTRLENGFYRRVTALQWDVRLIASNASIFNESGSAILRNANAVSETLLKFIEDHACQDPIPLLADLTHGDKKSLSSDDDSQNSRRKRKSKSQKDDSSKFVPRVDPDAWVGESESLSAMSFDCEDSEPFRLPVDPELYLLPADGVKRCRTTNRRSFYLVNCSDREIKELSRKIRSLGSSLHLSTKGFSAHVTHVICGKLRQTDDFIAACITGKWILTPEYVHRSFSQEKWLEEMEFQYYVNEDGVSELADAAKQWQWKVSNFGVTPFPNWNVAVLMKAPGSPNGMSCGKLLQLGGATVVRFRLPLKDISVLDDVVYIFLEEEDEQHVTSLQKFNLPCIRKQFIRDFIVKGGTADPFDYSVTQDSLKKKTEPDSTDSVASLQVSNTVAKGTTRFFRKEVGFDGTTKVSDTRTILSKGANATLNRELDESASKCHFPNPCAENIETKEINIFNTMENVWQKCECPSTEKRKHQESEGHCGKTATPKRRKATPSCSTEDQNSRPQKIDGESPNSKITVQTNISSLFASMGSTIKGMFQRSKQGGSTSRFDVVNPTIGCSFHDPVVISDTTDDSDESGLEDVVCIQNSIDSTKKTKQMKSGKFSNEDVTILGVSCLDSKTKTCEEIVSEIDDVLLLDESICHSRGKKDSFMTRQELCMSFSSPAEKLIDQEALDEKKFTEGKPLSKDSSESKSAPSMEQSDLVDETTHNTENLLQENAQNGSFSQQQSFCEVKKNVPCICQMKKWMHSYPTYPIFSAVFVKKDLISSLIASWMKGARELGFYTAALEHAIPTTSRWPSEAMLSELMNITENASSEISNKASCLLLSWLELHPPITKELINIYTDALGLSTSEIGLMDVIERAVASPNPAQIKSVLAFAANALEANVNSCKKRTGKIDKHKCMFWKWIWNHCMVGYHNKKSKQIVAGMINVMTKSPADYNFINTATIFISLIAECLRLSSTNWNTQSSNVLCDPVWNFIVEFAKQLSDVWKKNQQLISIFLQSIKPAWFRLLVSASLLSQCNNYLVSQTIDVRKISLETIVSQFFRLLPPLKTSQLKQRKTVEDTVSEDSVPEGNENWPITNLTAEKINQGNFRNFGETMVHKAAKKNDVKLMKQILSVPGVDVNKKDNNAWTPLHDACFKGSLECIELLLNYVPPLANKHFIKDEGNNRVDINARGPEGVSPLHKAVLAQKPEVCRLLLVHGGKNLLTSKTDLCFNALEMPTSNEVREVLSKAEQLFSDDLLNMRNNSKNSEAYNRVLSDGNKYANTGDCSVLLSLLSTLVSSYFETFLCGHVVQKNEKESQRRIERDREIMMNIHLHLDDLKQHIKNIVLKEDQDTIEMDIFMIESVFQNWKSMFNLQR